MSSSAAAIDGACNTAIPNKPQGYRVKLRPFFLFCRCCTEGTSLLVYLGGLCARGDLKWFSI